MKIRQIHLGSMIILLCLVLNPVIVKANVSFQTNPTETVPALSPTAETPTVDLPTEVPPTGTPVTITATPTPTEAAESPTPTSTEVVSSPILTAAVTEEPAAAENGDYWVIVSGPPHPPAGYEESTVELPEPNIAAGINTLSVPAYRWVYGCSAVSGAMIAAYYDRNGYPNLYTGPTNGGVAPMVEDSSWGSFTDEQSTNYPLNPIVASRNGLDSRTSRGSIDDYWRYYGSTSDPYATNGWSQHTWTTIGDYMKTSQATYGIPDGATGFDFPPYKISCDQMSLENGTLGRAQFYQSRGYTVDECYTQPTDNQVSGGFSFYHFKTFIDKGDPVFIHVIGHSMVGVGYNDSTNTIYLHDTWDNSTHSMPWGGSYSGMKLRAVSIVTLKSRLAAPTLIAPNGIVNTRTPQYVWYVTPNASKYWMTIARTSDGAYLYNSTITPYCNEVTCWVTPSVSLADGEYWYTITPGDADGWGDVSAAKSFLVTTQPPAAPILISPDGEIHDNIPQFDWYISPGATKYWMTVAKSDGTYVYNSYISPKCASYTYTCWITPELNLTGGDYWYQITAGNAIGWGNASSKMNFSVTITPPEAATLISPSGTATSRTPLYVWTYNANASRYWMTIARASDGAYLYNSTITPNCNEVTCWVTPDVPLADGEYWYKVTAGNAGGWGSVSASQSFTVETPDPPQLISPDSTITTHTPQFVWYASAGVTGYWMTIAQSNGTYVYNSSVTPSCNSYTCWITPQLNLPDGDYWYKVTAGNSVGWGSASSQMNFTVDADQPPDTPRLVSPSETISDNTPLYVWYTSPTATTYWMTIARSSDGAYLYNSYITPSCNSYTCWITPSISLANGSYWFKITAGNAEGWSSASSPMNFTVSSQTPAAPTLIAPDGIVPSGSPLFIWYANPSATAYWMTVVRSSDGAYVFNSYVTPNTNGYTCWMHLPGTLANGTYWYKVTAGNSAGWGSASSAMNFAVAVSSSPPPEIQPDRAVPLLK